MKVKGIELMKMIADGKIKEGTKIKIVGRFCSGRDKYFEFKKSSTFEIFDTENKLYDKDKWTGHITLCDLMRYSFEILEDKTEEIEEIQRSDSYVDQINNNRNKINELVKAVNRLNKLHETTIDTSKETNYMTD